MGLQTYWEVMEVVKALRYTSVLCSKVRAKRAQRVQSDKTINMMKPALNHQFHLLRFLQEHPMYRADCVMLHNNHYSPKIN